MIFRTPKYTVLPECVICEKLSFKDPNNCYCTFKERPCNVPFKRGHAEYIQREIVQCTFKERLCKLPLKRGHAVYIQREAIQCTF